MPKELDKAYEPASVEQRIYAQWERSAGFGPTGDGEPYCIVQPPPNVTGVLHIGHALDNSLQDAIIRRKRMQGYRALWLPGTDHAGIATQNVVERELAKEGLSRNDLGREAFVERVWEWKRHSGGRIVEQLKRLGSSCDWSRERFTMDDGLSRAVREIFTRLYDEKLIYRGSRIINWCPRCQTALSDIEVEHRDVEGELVQLAYPLKDDTGEIVIATTRVETMLGDTGVAVNPKDERYRDLVGKTAVLPIVGRELPIVADDAVDFEFGTGALKVTPALDPTDFEIGERHGLPAVNVLTAQAHITEDGGEFAGMDRYAARKAVTEKLRSMGVVREETRPYVHSVGHCYRCGTEVEPWLSDQWFVKVRPLAERAIEAVRNGDTRFVPQRYERNYMDWMENLRDWCISRQLWWGHRIPVYTCANGHEFASREEPKACPVDKNEDLTQDPDVLDTWFSSALWPFSTLGWPDETQDLRQYYPTSVLVTGYDIITFWVSRMMMMGLYAMNAVPFPDVHVHGMVRDFRGKKMSKSFGNVVDPLELLDKYGADALRMTLVRSATLGGDVPIAEQWVEGDRNFANKLWNASRFVFMNLGDEATPLPPKHHRTLADNWILSRLATVTEQVDAAMEAYDFATAAQMLRQFTWSEFCDWYIEWAKGPLTSGDEAREAAARGMLTVVLKTILELLHPLMPFITEELHTAMDGQSAMSARWPSADRDLVDHDAEGTFEFVQSVVSALRRFRADHQIPTSVRPDTTIAVPDAERRSVLVSEIERVRVVARWGEITLTDTGQAATGHARLVVSGAEIFIPMAGLFDVDAETTRLDKEIERLRSDADRIRAKLGNTDFVGKAPDEVVEQQRDRLAENETAAARLAEAREELRRR
ncbi:MAG: valine--tRNA ligase [Actinomycetota bacterium]|nr:valine--tRNA ligase [Actinomycetota bacterium]